MEYNVLWIQAFIERDLTAGLKAYFLGQVIPGAFPVRG
jgi:hypothetical protein